MKRCSSIFGHKFRARFNSEPAPHGAFKTGSLHVWSEDLVKMTTKTTYVHDICERCGQIVDGQPVITQQADLVVRLT